MTKPIITLKSVKVHLFSSEETYCFEASVYVDGKYFCKATNRGHGGPDNYFDFADGGHHNEEALSDLEKRIKEVYPIKEFHGLEMSESLESLVCEEVNKFLTRRDMKRSMKKGILAHRLEDGQILEWKVGPKRDRGSLLDALKERFKEHEWFDDMSEDRQLELWRAE